MKEIKRFNEDVLKSEQMQDEIKEIGNNLEKIVEYANSKGYEFTEDDIKNFSDNNVELTDDQLDSVSGGRAIIVEILSGVVKLIYHNTVDSNNNNNNDEYYRR